MKKNRLKLLVIIPTKMDSKRFPGKNMYLINGDPMFDIAIQYALLSSHSVHVVVSSEDDRVKQYMNKIWPHLGFHDRDKSLCGDVEVVDVYIDVAKNFEKNEFDLAVCLQPDNIGRVDHIDEYIEYMLENNYDDLVTVNTDFKRTGEIRIFKFNDLREGRVSKRVGTKLGHATDIHYKSDLENIKGLL